MITKPILTFAVALWIFLGLQSSTAHAGPPEVTAAAPSSAKLLARDDTIVPISLPDDGPDWRRIEGQHVTADKWKEICTKAAESVESRRSSNATADEQNKNTLADLESRVTSICDARGEELWKQLYPRTDLSDKCLAKDRKFELEWVPGTIFVETLPGQLFVFGHDAAPDAVLREYLASTDEVTRDHLAIAWLVAELHADYVTGTCSTSRLEAGAAYDILPTTGNAMIDAFGAFVANRAQRELGQWFIAEFGRDLCEKGSPTRCLFPQTCMFFASEADPMIALGTIVEALRRDLRDLPPNLGELIAGDRGRAWAAAIMYLYDAMRDGNRVLDTIAGLSAEGTPIADKLGEVCVFGSDPLGSPACTMLFVSLTTRRAYAQLTQAQYEARLRQLGLVDIASAKESFTELFAATEQLAKALKKAEKELTDEGYTEDTIEEQRRKLRDLLRHSLNYFEAVSEAGAKIGFSSTSSFSAWTSLAAFGGDLVAADYRAAALELAALLAGLPPELQERVPEGTFEVISLVLTFAAAETSEEIEAALETVAAPVGSWRAKHKYPMISLGALAGLGAGVEFGLEPIGRDLTYAKYGISDVGAVGSVYATLGLDFSWNFRQRPGSFGLFISTIDVGKLLTVRSVGTERKASEVQAIGRVPEELAAWRVIAPGLFMRVGLGRSPMAWFFGASWTPAERVLTETDGERFRRDALRVISGIAVDIVIVPFRSKKTKAK